MKLQPAIQIPPETGIADNSPTLVEAGSRDILTAAKGGGITFAGKLFEYAVRFVFSIIVARAIGVKEFGLYTLGLTLAPIASMLALLGLQTSMVRFMPSAIRQRDDEKVWGIIQVSACLPGIISLVFSATIYLFAEPIAIQIFKDPRLAPILRLVCFSIPLEALSFMGNTVIQSYKRLEYRVFAEYVVLPVVKLLLTIGFLLAGLGTLGIIKAHIIAGAVGLAVIIYFVNSLFPLKRPINGAQRNVVQLLRYSLPAHVGWVIKTLSGTFETLVLGFLGLTIGVGVYAAAGRLSAIGVMLYLSLAAISAPIIADLYSRDEIEQLKSFYRTTTRWLVLSTLPLCLTLILFADPLLAIFGAEFKAGATALAVLAVGTLICAGTGVGATLLDYTDHVKVNSVNSVFMVVITLGLDLLFIPRWGVLGAAAAASLSMVIVNVLCLLEVLVLVHMQPYDRSILKPLVAATVSVTVYLLFIQRFYVSPFLQLTVGGIGLWGVYILTLIALGLSVEDRTIIDGLHSRYR